MIGDTFSDIQDSRMKETAEEIMRTKKVTTEQNSEVIAWLLLTVLTIKKSLWSPSDLADAIDARISSKSVTCDKFRTACETADKILSKPWPWIACFSPWFCDIVGKVLAFFSK